jgi:molecular chaperone GrpE (heat shock protein)
MKWKFWISEKKALEQLQELLTPINHHLTLLNQQATANSEQMVEISDQVRKLGRLQYKSGQEVQGKLEGLNKRLEGVQQWQDTYSLDKSRLDSLEQQIGQVSEILLVWLDDFDLLASNLREQGQVGWLKLLDTWTQQVLQALRIHGIIEIQLVGTSFNPILAEAIGTVARTSLSTAQKEATQTGRVSVSYEVAEVVKRGFTYQDGSLIRKAQVITYQES